ncbi:MAG: SPOR domain-containing protein [Bacteroidia bacterium]|nr:SPOR domain-containing protein [Bacteroidia bacterium]
MSYSQPADEKNNIAETQYFSENFKVTNPVDAVEIYYYFDVSEDHGSSPDAKFKLSSDVPEGLNYRIQVAAFRNPVSGEFFKGFSPVYIIPAEGSDLKKYCIGMFRRISDARIAQEKVRENGFKSSFIASFDGTRSVSIEQAAELEKKWGSIPFERIESVKPLVVKADTATPSPSEKQQAVIEPVPVEHKDTLRLGALKIFIDCRSCDMNYTRQEIPFVNYVRDTREAEVYLLVTNQPAGSGGDQFTFAFQGLQKYDGMNDTLTYTSNPDETWAIIREKKTNMIKMGLMRYVARTPLFDEIDIKNTGEIKQHEIEDKWNNWVFELQTSPQFNAEETYNRIAFFNSFQVTRVTPDIKLEIELDQFTNKQRYIEDEVTTEYVVSSKSLQNLFVKSLGNHWSGGLRFDIESSTSQNYDLNIDFLPTIEYDIYPYSEATHRQFRIMYSIGYEYSDYTDTTIYNMTVEGLFKHSIRGAYQIQKKWGSINISGSYTNYLDDFSKNRFGFWGYTRLRIVKGLSLSVNAGVTYINNQINLAKGELSEAERLLRLKQQATNFYLNGGVSLSYTFGSIYNNVVNPRFGNNNN